MKRQKFYTGKHPLGQRLGFEWVFDGETHAVEVVIAEQSNLREVAERLMNLANHIEESQG